MILDTFTFLFKPEGQEKVKEAAKGLTDFFGQQAEAQKVKLDNLMGVVAPLIAAYGTLRTIMSFTDDNEQLYNVSNMTGIATQSMRELGFATEQFGGGLSSAVGTLSHLQSMIQQVRTTGGGALTSAASKYGLAFSNDPEQLLRNIAKRMEGMNKAQQVDFGRMLGLDNPTIQLLQKGLKGVNEELKRAHELNFMDEETLEASHALVKDIREMVILFKGMAQTMSVQFHPELQSIVSAIRNGSLYLLKHREVLEGIAQKVLFIGKLYAGWKLASLLTSPKGLMGLAVAGGGLLHEDYKVWKRLKKTGNAELDKKLRNNTLMGRLFGIGEDAVKKFDTDWKNLKDHVEKTVKDYIEQSEYLSGVKSIWKDVWEEMTNEDTSLIDKIKALGQGIADTFELTFKTIKNKISNTEIGKYFIGLWDQVEKDAKDHGWVTAIGNMFSTMLDDLIKIIEPKIKPVKDSIKKLLGFKVNEKGEEVNPFIEYMKELYNEFIKWLQGTETYKSIKAWFDNLQKNLEEEFDKFSKNKKASKSMSTFFTDMLRDSLEAKEDETTSQALIRKIGELFEGAVSGLQNSEKFQKAVAKFNKDFWEALGVEDSENKTFSEKMGNIAENSIDKFKEVWKKNKESIKKSIAETIAEGIADGFSSLWDNIKNASKEKVNAVGEYASNKSDEAIQWFKNLMGINQNQESKSPTANDIIQKGVQSDLNLLADKPVMSTQEIVNQNTNNITTNNSTTNNTNYFQTPINNDQFFEITRNSGLYHAAGGR